MVDYLGITILLGSFILLLILRTPISFALLASAILTSFYLKVPLMSVAVQMVKGIHSFSLLAIPFFYPGRRDNGSRRYFKKDY